MQTRRIGPMLVQISEESGLAVRVISDDRTRTVPSDKGDIEARASEYLATLKATQEPQHYKRITPWWEQTENEVQNVIPFERSYKVA